MIAGLGEGTSHAHQSPGSALRTGDGAGGLLRVPGKVLGAGVIAGLGEDTRNLCQYPRGAASVDGAGGLLCISGGLPGAGVVAGPGEDAGYLH